MNAREVRDIVRTQFTIAIRSLDETEEDKKNLKFDGGSMRVVLQMIQMEIVEDLYKLEANEIAKAVKEVEDAHVTCRGSRFEDHRKGPQSSEA